jgi:hypothetical protein
MNIYKTPDSSNQEPENRQCKPINAICYGLLISIVLTMIVSIIEVMIFAIIIAVTQGSENISADFMTGNSLFLIIDLIVTFGCLFYAGKITGKYAFGQELKFGLIVALLTLLIYVLIYFTIDSTENYPVWYDLMTYINIFVAILWGAKSVKRFNSNSDNN